MIAIESSRSRWVVALAGLVLGACGAEAPGESPMSEAELADGSEALVNGNAPTGMGDGGTVMLDFWNGSAWQRSCSGQIVARDAVLTSAHCFRFFGRPAGNSWSFVVWRQRPNGTWVNHTRTATNGGWMPGTFTLHPQYAGVEQPRNTWVNHTVKNDVAVLRFEANLVGIDSSDTTYLDNGPQLPRNAQVWGYSTGTLRQGPYEVDFDFGAGVYRTIPKGSDPRACPGDSGGPLKRAESLFEQDGIQIGVISTASGACLNAGVATFFTAVQPNISFITGTLPGRCSDVTGLPTIGPVPLKRCW
jgi:hypothetical protein